MVATTFDTHQAVKNLLAAGFADDQAEAVVAMMGQAANGRWATKDDLTDLTTKTDFAELRSEFAELKTEFAELKGEVIVLKGAVIILEGEVAVLKTDVAELRGEFAELKGGFFELRSDVAALRSDVEGMKSSLNNIRWMIVLLVTLFGIMAALFFAVAIQHLFF